MKIYKIEKNEGTFKGVKVPLLKVVDEAEQTVFKMPIKFKLIHAITSCGHLWVLEDTPMGVFSTDVNLTTGKGQSRKLEDDGYTNSRTFQYSSTDGKDRWEILD